MATTPASGIKLVFAVLLLSAVAADCLGNISQSGAVCDILDSYKSYSNKQDYCNSANADTSTLLNYCKFADCSVCDNSLETCGDLIGDMDMHIMSKKFNAPAVVTDVTNYEGHCSITMGEDCYRQVTSDQAYVDYYEDDSSAVDGSDTRCCMYECYTTFPLKSTGCGSDGNNYTDIKAFCALWCDDRTMTLKQCGDAGCGVAQGCPDNCQQDTMPPPFCGDNYTFYSDITTYCTDKSNGTVTDVIDCNPDCSQAGCNKLSCINDNSNYLVGSVCLQTSIASDYFFIDVDDYCTAKVAALETDYVVSNYLTCNSTGCTDAVSCCEARCLTETYFDSCNTANYILADHQAFCAYRCDNSNTNNTDMTIQGCTNNGSPVNCTQNSCDLYGCQNQLVTIASHSDICAKNDVFYANVSDYCEVYPTTFSSNMVMCGTNDCKSDYNCCVQNCTNRETSGYVGKCNTTDYIFHSDVAGYCASYCNASRSFPVYSLNGNVATEAQCCEATCVKQGGNIMCNLETYSVYPLSAQCEDTCANNTVAKAGCTGDCTAPECLYLGCEHALAAYSASDQVCGNNSVLYSDVDTYCTAYMGNTSLSVVDCVGGKCTTPSSCCSNVCYVEEQPGYQTTCDVDYNIYDTYTDFCDAKCTVQNFQESDCGGPRCTKSECCLNKCNGSAYSEAFCDANFVLLNQTDYCNAHCANAATVFVQCTGGCTQDKCSSKECLAAIQSYGYTSICLPPSANLAIRYVSHEDFCDAKVTAKSTDFSTVSFISCNNAECDADECCYASCMTEPFKKSCDANSNFVTQDDYCLYRCGNSNNNMSITKCYDSNNTQIDCTNCSAVTCKTDYEASYPGVNTVCADSDVYYTAVEDYCNAKALDAGLGLRLCDNSTPCANTKDCCLKNCNSADPASYQAKCADTDFTWLAQLTDYCDYYCGHSRTFTEYMLSGNSATEDECYVAKCLKAGTYHDACIRTDYTVTTPEEQCTREYNSEPNDVYSCGSSNCDDTDCGEAQCREDTFISNANDPGFCSNNNVYYTTLTSFCSAYVASAGMMQFVTCNNQACADSAACCKQNCLNENTSSFIPTCDADFNRYNTVDDYCTAKCGNSFNELLCSGSLCTKKECCTGKCMAAPFIDSCIPSETNSLFDDHSMLCNAVCVDPDNLPTVDNCSNNGCKQADCNNLYCQYHQTDTKYCSSMGDFYGSKADYCTAFSADTSITTIKCNNAQCADAESCCEASCVSQPENSQANYQPKCSSTYEYLATGAQYCHAKCSDNNYASIMCSSTPCTEEQCCLAKCNAEPYVPVCDSSYGLMAKADYCSAYCANTSFSHITCTNGCTDTKCTEQKCMDTISASQHSTICLNKTANLDIFYDTQQKYCAAKVAANETDYNNSNIIDCNGNACDKDGCTYASCFNDFTFVGCNSSFNLVPKADFCQYRVDHGTDETISYCTDQNDNKVDCINCDVQRCISDINAVYTTPDTVCANSYDYFLSKTAYCKAKAVDSSLAVQYCDSNNAPCADSANCCVANCKQEFGANYQPQCNTNDYIFSPTIEDYCESYCLSGKVYNTYYVANTNIATEKQCYNAYCLMNTTKYDACVLSDYSFITKSEQCDAEFDNSLPQLYSCTNDCTSDQCDIQKCVHISFAANQNETNICGSDNNVYNNMTNFCGAFTTNGSLQYVECDGSPCGNATNCCRQNCLNTYSGSFYNTCDADFNSYTNVTDYCNAKCAPNFNQKLCGGNLCTSAQCCNSKCLSQNFVNSCIPSLTESLFTDQTDLCTAVCTDPDNQPAVNNCSGTGCTANNCKVQNCAFPLSGSQCSTDGDLYATPTDYCNRKIYNVGLNTITCNGGKCADAKTCCIQDCHNDYPVNFFQPRCDTNYVIYTDRDSYCEGKCADKQNFRDYNCIYGYCSVQDCCIAGCNREVYTSVCDSSFNLLSQGDYCNKRCANSSYPFLTCTGACTQPKCDSFKCVSKISSYSHASICLSATLNNMYFFDTKAKFCDAKLAVSDTNYVVTGDLDCNGVDCNNQDCCNKRCNAQPYFVGCNSAKSLISQVDYCNYRCMNNDNNMSLDYCYDTSGGTPTKKDCPDCDNPQCLVDIEQRYSSPSTVCGTNDVFYSAKSDYCTAKGQDSTINLQYCDSNTSTVCTTDLECCNANCIVKNTANYAGKCDSTNFIFDSTVEAYCDRYCKNNRVYNVYQISNVNATQEECCVAACPTPTQDLCDASTFDFVPTASQCQKKCADTTVSFVQCNGGNCLQGDCDMLKCKAATVDSNVCGSNGVFYATDTAFCTEKLNSNINAVQCNGNTCADALACCNVKCIADNPANTYQSRCDTAYNFYETNTDYCNAYCQAKTTSTPFANLYCDVNNTILCNKSQCCNKKCSSNTYNGVCDSSYNLLSQNDYCSTTCDNSASTLYTCTGGCNQQKCSEKNCAANIGPYNYSSVCLNTAIDTTDYFSTIANYCTARVLKNQTNYALATADYQLCSGINCGSPSNCCVAKCMVANPYSGCNNNNLMTSLAYCTQKCGGATYTLQYCGNKDCPSCAVSDCFAQNTAYTDNTVCLLSALNTNNYFGSLFDYCTAAVAQNVTQYSLSNKTTQCSGSACASGPACCEARCLLQPYTSLCDTNTGSSLTQAAYCQLKCANTSHTISTCLDASQNQIACTDDYCANFGCMDFLRHNYSYNTLCLVNSVQSKYFYLSLTDYCADVKPQGALTVVPSNDTCTQNGGLPECANDAACCVSRCLTETYYKGCDASTNLITHLDFCTSRCGSPSNTAPSLQYCGSADCANCNFVKCPLDNANYSQTGVCLKSNVNNAHFFDSIAKYCDAAIAAGNTTFALASSDYYSCTNGTCTQQDCCNNWCLNTGTYTNVCNGSDFSVLSRTTHCQNSCYPNTNTELKCFDGDNNQIGCTSELCCEKKVANVAYPVCGTDGTIYTSSTNFCTAKDTNTALDSVTLNPPAYPVCGSDYQIYNSFSSICSAKASNTALATINACGNQTCTPELCCVAECASKPAAPVVVLFPNNTLVSYKNSCYARCANLGSVLNTVKTCAASVNQDDCKASYCTDSHFCGLTTDVDYYGYVCANDGKVYENTCIAGCHNKNVVEECPKKCSDDTFRLKRCAYACQVNLLPH